MADDAQFWDDIIIQNFTLDDSLELNSASGGGTGHGIPHVRNWVTINNGNIFVGYHSYVNTECMVQVTTDLCYKYIELANIDLKKKKKEKEIIRQRRRKRKK